MTARLAPTSSGGSPVRVAHVVSHPIQYFVPLYRELAQRPEIELTVYFLSDATAGEHHDRGFDRTISWGDNMLAGYRSRVCKSAMRTSPDQTRRRAHLDVVGELWRGRYDAVWFHGYDFVTVWFAALAALLRRSQILLRDEQTLLRNRSWWRLALKRALLPLLFRRATGLPIGEENRRYMLHYGVLPERLFPARYCVDNKRFRRLDDELRPQRHALRHSLGITDESPVVLFCGKLYSVKQPLLLLDAFRAVRDEIPCWLLVVGDGPMRAEIEHEVAQLEVPNVVLTGFLGQDEISRAYAAADVFVLPSTAETWGLVVNEAMNFGLPVVVSSGVGCAVDLVEHGHNGFLVDPRSPGELTRAIRDLVSDSGIRTRFGERSRSLIDEYSIERCADGIIAACLPKC